MVVLYRIPEEAKQVKKDPNETISLTYAKYAEYVRNEAGRQIGIPGCMLADADITGYPDDCPVMTRAEWVAAIKDAAECFLDAQDDASLIRALFS